MILQLELLFDAIRSQGIVVLIDDGDNVLDPSPALASNPALIGGMLANGHMPSIESNDVPVFVYALGSYLIAVGL